MWTGVLFNNLKFVSIPYRQSMEVLYKKYYTLILNRKQALFAASMDPAWPVRPAALNNPHREHERLE